MQLDQLTASATYPVTLAGQSFTVRKLKLREWGELQAWLKHAVPSPIAEAARALIEAKTRGEDIPNGIRREILDHAQEAARLWPPRVGSMPWILALEDTAGGTARFVSTALGASGYTLTEDGAEQLAGDSTNEELADLIRVCLHGEAPSPKSKASTTGPPLNWIEAMSSQRLMTGESCSSVSTPIPAGASTESST